MSGAACAMNTMSATIASIVRRLANLERNLRSCFFLVLTHRMAPLYEHALASTGWGTPTLMWLLAEEVWARLDGREECGSWSWPSVENAVPHADDIDNLAASDAMAAFVLVDAARNVLIGNIHLELVEYAFGPFLQRVSLRRFDVLEVGSAEEYAVDRMAALDAWIQREADFQESLLLCLEERMFDDFGSLKSLVFKQPIELPPIEEALEA